MGTKGGYAGPDCFVGRRWAVVWWAVAPIPGRGRRARRRDRARAAWPSEKDAIAFLVVPVRYSLDQLVIHQPLDHRQRQPGIALAGHCLCVNGRTDETPTCCGEGLGGDGVSTRPMCLENGGRLLDRATWKGKDIGH